PRWLGRPPSPVRTARLRDPPSGVVWCRYRCPELPHSAGVIMTEEAVRSVAQAVQAAHASAPAMASADEPAIDAALRAMARLLAQTSDVVLKANAEDVAAASASGMSGGLLDRLRLDPARLTAMAAQITALADVPAEP